MRITKVNIPKNHITGIEAIEMTNLKQFVVLAGKNGAGKSRILQEVKETINSLLIGTKKELIETRLRQNIAAKDATLTAPQNASTEQDIRQFETNIADFTAKLSRSTRLEVQFPNENIKAIDYLPDDLDFKCPRKMTPEDVLNKAVLVDGLDSMSNISISAYPLIQTLQDRDINVRYEGFTGEDSTKEKAIEEYRMLQTIVRELLGAELGRDKEGAATIFNLPLGKSDLSDGQKVLLGLAVSLLRQDTKLDEAILILDEPENHLHPAALTEVFDRLSSCVSKGQIWVATHSISLLSRFAPSEIWYVEDGRASSGGPQMMNVLTSLIGDENHIAKIHSFLDLPAVYTMNKYSYECMFEPKAIMTGIADLQSLQINDIITNLKDCGDKLKVLDFGAGIGRLPAFIAEIHPDAAEWLDYRAFDEYPDGIIECEQNIAKIYGSSAGRYFNRRDDFLSANPGWKSDLVIMTNVLHEIDPERWLIVFEKQGLLMSVLSDEGSLLIVEDQLIGKGEKAYKNGFLVLDTLHLQILFELGTADGFRLAKQSDDHRLKAHLIHKSLLSNINAITRSKTLEAIAMTAKDEIQRLRSEAPSYNNGRYMAFWLQQFATAQLEYDEHRR